MRCGAHQHRKRAITCSFSMLVAGGEVRRIRERCGEGSNPPQDGGGMRWCWKTTTDLENKHECLFSMVVVLAVSKRRKKKNGGHTFAPAVFVVSGLLLYPCYSSWAGAYRVGEVCVVIGGGRGVAMFDFRI